MKAGILYYLISTFITGSDRKKLIKIEKLPTTIWEIIDEHLIKKVIRCENSIWLNIN